MEGGQTAMQTLTTAFTTAVGTIADDAMDLLGAALPSALAVGGAIIAIGAGWRLFKRFSK